MRHGELQAEYGNAHTLRQVHSKIREADEDKNCAEHNDIQ